jgi:hypothetical protein
MRHSLVVEREPSHAFWSFDASPGEACRRYGNSSSTSSRRFWDAHWERKEKKASQLAKGASARYGRPDG